MIHRFQFCFNCAFNVNLRRYIKATEADAWLSLKLMFHLSVLPLTRQLSNIAGNLWAKTLQHTRAQRVEYLVGRCRLTLSNAC
jgi:DNA polymerase alpha subunit A